MFRVPVGVVGCVGVVFCAGGALDSVISCSGFDSAMDLFCSFKANLCFFKLILMFFRLDMVIFSKNILKTQVINK